MKAFLFIGLLSLVTMQSFGQTDKNKILTHFNKVDYFPGSLTIKSAYMENDGKADGIGIDFNENGEPTAIGAYKNGARYGWWALANGCSINYSKSPAEYGIPPCGRAVMFGAAFFKKIYNRVFTDPTLNTENIWEVVK